MLGLGWSEILVVVVIGLVVVRPADLPRLMSQSGRALKAVRRMSGDFQRELNDALKLDQIEEVGKAVAQPLEDTPNAPGVDGKKMISGSLASQETVPDVTSWRPSPENDPGTAPLASPPRPSSSPPLMSPEHATESRLAYELWQEKRRERQSRNPVPDEMRLGGQDQGVASRAKTVSEAELEA